MTELKVKCSSCGHLQRLFDYEKHTFSIPATDNENFNKWLSEHDKQIRAEVIDDVEQLMKKYVSFENVDVFVETLRKLKEQK